MEDVDEEEEEQAAGSAAKGGQQGGEDEEEEEEEEEEDVAAPWNGLNRLPVSAGWQGGPVHAAWVLWRASLTLRGHAGLQCSAAASALSNVGRLGSSRSKRLMHPPSRVTAAQQSAGMHSCSLGPTVMQ